MGIFIMTVEICYRDPWMSVVHHQQLLQRTYPPKLLAGF